MRALLLLITVLFAAPSTLAALKSQTVEYKAGDVVMQGYLVWDDAIPGPRPGVLVVHEWWGQNGYARHRADMLADMGYTALALDMYGDGKVTEHPDEAGKFYQKVTANQDVLHARFNAALKLLKDSPEVIDDQIAAIGYCFGGSVVLEMARRGADLDVVASFHGGLKTEHPAEPGAVGARVLVFNGAADPMAPQADVDALHGELINAKASYLIVSYPGAQHSFTNPAADAVAKRTGMPLGYQANADRDSWARLAVELSNAFVPEE
ncbi:MAG TPA: dienelactone hydrolase family protein [Spongiibacteraceae bacterium]|jgi:dienelactone hydrolase|nr:dienelactone hydrolase family protein [Spongiibacteraceae bacterium]HUH37519.1 dienelactone hydrolase family protein [Spongiibacteraceae bacterium]